MKKRGKKAMRLARRRALPKFATLPRLAGAAAVVAPSCTQIHPAQADLIEYVAHTTVQSVTGVNNTIAGDTATLRVTIESDDIVSDGWTPATFSTAILDFEFSIDGSATEIWNGTGGYLSYRDSGRFNIGLRATPIGTANYDTVGEFPIDYAGLDHYPLTEGSFTSFHPSGAPLGFDLSGPESRQFFYFTSDYDLRDVAISTYIDSIVGTVISGTPDPDPDPDPNPCAVIADANCDGIVDIAGDILPGFANFTGPCVVGVDCQGDPGNGGSVFTKSRAQGDVHDETNGATDSETGHDGDIDVSDLLAMFAAFTGPATDEAAVPTPATSLVDTLVAADSATNVLPAGFDLSGLAPLASGDPIRGGVSSLSSSLELLPAASVPEPTTAMLAATAGLAGLVALRRKRRES